MALPSTTDLMVTTLLVTNIHCPSCVSYATDVLSPFSEYVRSLNISIMDNIVRIHHVGNITERLARALIKASFEVEHVTLTDSTGGNLREYSIRHVGTALPEWLFVTLFGSKDQKRHIETCGACQDLRRDTDKRKTSWADVLRFRRAKWRTPSATAALEDGILRNVGASSDSQATVAAGSDEQVTAEEGRFTVMLSIEGMTCASCVSAITHELKDQDYIESVHINLLTNNAKVGFHGLRTNADVIKDVIEDIGYGAEIEAIHPSAQEPEHASIFKASLSIDGMTCGSCVGTITRAIEGLSFVQTVDVDLVSNSGTVTFSGKHNVDSILEAVDEAGYDAKVVSVDEIAQSKQQTTSEDRSVQIEALGMYCANCPSNILTAIETAFDKDIMVTQMPTLKDPRMTVFYRPIVPDLTIRRIIETINSADPEISASIYHPPSLEDRSRTIRRKERNRVLRHLLVALIVAIPSFIIGVVYMSLVPKNNSIRQWFEEPIWAGDAMRIDWALFIMTTPAMFYGASIFHVRALKEIWSLWRPRSKAPLLRRFYRFGSMNLLISAGTSVAYFASLAVLVMAATTSRGEGAMGRSSSTYFDTVTFLTLFVLIGRYLEAYSKAKTGDAVSMLANLRPSTALLVESEDLGDGNGEKSTIKHVSVDMLEVGDTVSIPHGACPPTDGIVAQEGNFVFDESSLTGESRPAKKIQGDKIFTGSVNVGDPIRMKVTETGGKSMLDQIVNVVREGQAKRAPIERLADKLTGYFTPAITLLAVGTWVIWLALGESGVLPHGWLDVARGGWPYWTVEFAIAVFVVACPCGIGLAAPTALFVGGGLAAKNGILVQGGGEAFQEASRLNAIVLDKTGTLTEGRMRVTEVEFLDDKNGITNGAAFAITKALEEASTHPIAKAIVKHCDAKLEDESESNMKTLSIKEVPGQGMSGKFEILSGSDNTIYEAVIGNERLVNSVAVEGSSANAGDQSLKQSTVSKSNVFLSQTLSRFQSLGNSTAILAIRRLSSSVEEPPLFTPVAIFAITDPLRPEAPEILASLRAQGLSIHMCTGDNAQTAHSIASQLLIPPSNVRAEVLPQDKAKYIQELQTSPDGSRRIIGFVGDGTNDTPALTVADVSIALSHPEGGGSDIALTSSSFVLLNSDLTSILTLVKLSKRVFLRVKLNFGWAAIYNICLIPVAAGVFFPIGASWDGANAQGGFRLSPVWASVAMAGSSISVVLSSLALRLPEVEFDILRRRFSMTTTIE